VQELVKKLNAICDEKPYDVSWYLKDLRSGQTADRAGNIVVPSASTRKVSILMAMMKAINDGRYSLDQMVTLKAKYQDNDSGAFQHFIPGFQLTLRDVMMMMIIVSDNTCTGTVTDMVGLEVLNAYCRSIGMKNTTHQYGLPPRDGGKPTTTTPDDQGMLLESILKGTEDEKEAKRLGSTKELCKLALQILSWQLLNTRLPNLLPAGTRVAHKTGTGPHNYNDVGIIYQGQDKPLFILATYTGNVPVELPDGTPGFASAAQTIGKLARTAYDALKH
jgi:beta-lactamase class A